MHKHEHSCCKHECLHFCSYCDKVYCCKCGKEWGGYLYWYQPPYYPYWDTTTIAPYCKENDSTTVTFNACTHTH